MSEKLLDRALRRVQESNDRALARAADAEAKLAQAQDLLTALGVPLTTDPSDNGRSRVLSSLSSSAPRRLTLSERIMFAAGVRTMSASDPAPTET